MQYKQFFPNISLYWLNHASSYVKHRISIYVTKKAVHTSHSTKYSDSNRYYYTWSIVMQLC